MTVPHPMEVELKLALPPQQVEAFLKLMSRRRAPVQQALLTRYFDTPDFALSAKGVALRVRRVEQRWLQTLKTEGERTGGLSRRVEYEMPIRRGEPDWALFPPEARIWVPEALRAQVQPVFETRFKRTAWQIKGARGAAIEVALDIGRVIAGKRSQPICEIELELKAGQPDALFELAQRWARRLDCLPFDTSKAERGVRLAHDQSSAPEKSTPLGLHKGMTAEEGFAAAVQACLTQFQANLPGVLDSDDIEYVHQARVALRRLRAVLRAFRKTCTPPDELLDGLRALNEVLARVRDLDVLCAETLPGIAPYFVDQRVWQAGMDILEAHRRQVRASMQQAVLRLRPGVWLLAFQRWLLQQGRHHDGGPHPTVQPLPLKVWARRTLKKGHRALEQEICTQAHDMPERCHALRITIKHQRYAVGFFGALVGCLELDRYQALLRELQSELGRLHDTSMAFELISKLGDEMGTMRPFLLGWLAARQQCGLHGTIENKLKNFVKRAPCW